MSRKRSASIALGATFLAAALAACGPEPEPDHSQACMEQQSELRADDDNCHQQRTGFVWIYYPFHVAVPPVGQRLDVKAGSFVRPAGSITTVQRGGFGGRITSGGGS